MAYGYSKERHRRLVPGFQRNMASRLRAAKNYLNMNECERALVAVADGWQILGAAAEHRHVLFGGSKQSIRRYFKIDLEKYSRALEKVQHGVVRCLRGERR